MSTPAPVQITNWPPEDIRILVWAVIAGVAGIVAAVAALWDMAISLRTLARKSALTAKIANGVSDWQWSDSGKYIYSVGCNIINSGSKGLPDFRVTLYFSPGCLVNGVQSNHKYVTGGPHHLMEGDWYAAEINPGNIYADDEVFVGNVIILAVPGDYKVCWVIKSEDERVPRRGYSKPVDLSLPSPPPPPLPSLV